MRRITIKRARTWRYRKMRPCIGPSNDLAPLSRFRSWRGCITNTSAYDFRKGQGLIIVSLPGTQSYAIYTKAADQPQLVLVSSFAFEDHQLHGRVGRRSTTRRASWGGSHKSPASQPFVLVSADEGLSRPSSRNAEWRPPRHDARHQLEGSVPKATSWIAARGEARLFPKPTDGPNHTGRVSGARIETCQRQGARAGVDCVRGYAAKSPITQPIARTTP
jgi:hypothetical protein